MQMASLSSRRHEKAALNAAEAIQAAEDHIREACRSGLRLDEPRRHYNYHRLQRPQS